MKENPLPKSLAIWWFNPKEASGLTMRAADLGKAGQISQQSNRQSVFSVPAVSG